jgi:hypothetical protein
MVQAPTSDPGVIDLLRDPLDEIFPELGKKGLTLEGIQIGQYGEIPEYSDNYTARPRGAIGRPSAIATTSYQPTKREVWSEACAMLYEEAVARQWSSATDIPWETIQELPDDMEMAMCQVCTFLTQIEYIAAEVPGRWVAKLSPDYFEVAAFLQSQAMDESRHMDVFRKRVLANGGGMQPARAGSSGVLAVQDFTEMTTLVHVLGEGLVQTLFRTGELFAQNPAEKRIFRLAAQDESRHVAFGVTHLKYLVDTEPERIEQIHDYFDRMEDALGAAAVSGSQGEIAVAATTSEPLAVLLGGGIKNLDEGYAKLRLIRNRQYKEYMHRLDVVGIDRRSRVNPLFQQVMETAEIA